MLRPFQLLLAAAALIIIATTLLACGRDEAGSGTSSAADVRRDHEVPHPLLDTLPEAVTSGGSAETAPPAPPLAKQIGAMAEAAGAARGLDPLKVDYPLNGSVFPPDFVMPTFLWHDDAATDTWLVRVAFEGAEDMTLAVPYAPRPRGEIDERARSETNELYLGTDYQNSAVAWTPSRSLWEEMKKRSLNAPARITFTGFASSAPSRPLSEGSVTIETSTDPVGAPIFYRDVPLMPDVGRTGKIRPLSRGATPLIAWRLRDVSRPDSKVVLTGMPTCGNCHSFSLDGKTLGMDIDGPQGDKGTYAIKTLEKNTTIDYNDIITWNSFEPKPKDHKTIGFLSRMSPDGQYVVSTVNESLFVTNFKNFRYLQVFYPTRGILAYYSRATGEMEALPGADDPTYVHVDPVWSPDGKWLVFARAEAFDPFVEGQRPATYANDPNEPQIQYSLYRIPFNEGRGGKAERIVGASDNGMSNTFPKISPDGKWIVWVKCKNGQLMRPDGRLWIMPFEGGEPREMICNTDNMNSWHSFSPNSRWMVFSSKTNRPYTEAFLTHIDEDGNDTPAILVPNCTADNRAVNLPEFLNAPYDALDSIDIPAVRHHEKFWDAHVAFEKKDYPSAVVHLEAALADEPVFTNARLNLGRSLIQLGRLDEAIDQFELAREISPGDFEPNLELGMAWVDSGRPDKAVLPLKKALKIVPNHVPTRRALVRAYQDLGRIDEAILQLEKMLAVVPEDRDGTRILAGMLFQMGRAPEGIDALTWAVRVDPENMRLVTTLAWHLATYPSDEVRDGKRALQLASRAVEMTREERRPEPLDALAAALAESGRYDEAVQVAEDALRLAQKDSPVLARDLRGRIALYRKHQPFRAPLKR